MAAAVAPVRVSAGAVRLRIGLFHLATTRMTPKNDTTFATKAVATPAAAITAPATGVATAFVANVVSFFGVILVVARWKRPIRKRTAPAETLTGATAAAIRYVRNSPA